jgi:hypothetical protein
MRKIVFAMMVFLVAGCAGYPVFEDRSDEVKIKHRIPSK